MYNVCEAICMAPVMIVVGALLMDDSCFSVDD